MIEPILSLSLSVHANRGVYALLLGSGISRSARILTGWDIVLDLVRQLAYLSEEDCEPELGSWYEQKYEGVMKSKSKSRHKVESFIGAKR